MLIFNEFINDDSLVAKLSKIFIILSGVFITFLLLMKSPLGKLIFKNTLISIIIFICSTKYIVSSKKTEKVKIRTSIFILSYFICFLPIFSYFQVFNFINYTKSSVFYDYATKGQYKKEVIFTEENLNDNELESTIEQICKEGNININGLKVKQSLYGALSNEQEITRELLNKNQKFQKYLKTINWNTDDVIEYMGVFANLDEIVLKGSLYIALFLAQLFCLLKSNIRAELYVIAGVTYIISVLGMVTNDFTSIIIFNNYPYDEVTKIMEMINIIKESFLTFIIFDTLIQLINDKQNNSKLIVIEQENKNEFKKEIEDEFKQKIKNEIKKEIKNELKPDINKLINRKEISTQCHTNNKKTANNRTNNK